MGKNVAVKLPAAFVTDGNDPVWRKYYSKEHAPAEDEPVSSKNKSAQGKKGGRKSVSDESSGSD
ncbi:hypothetical protein NBRC10512v2_003148 [Rhodotorula toruloides]